MNLRSCVAILDHEAPESVVVTILPSAYGLLTWSLRFIDPLRLEELRTAKYLTPEVKRDVSEKEKVL